MLDGGRAELLLQALYTLPGFGPQQQLPRHRATPELRHPQAQGMLLAGQHAGVPADRLDGKRFQHLCADGSKQRYDGQWMAGEHSHRRWRRRLAEQRGETHLATFAAQFHMAMGALDSQYHLLLPQGPAQAQGAAGGGVAEAGKPHVCLSASQRRGSVGAPASGIIEDLCNQLIVRGWQGQRGSAKRSN